MISDYKNVSSCCVENRWAGKTFTKRASVDSVMIRGVSGGMEKGG